MSFMDYYFIKQFGVILLYKLKVLFVKINKNNITNERIINI